MNCYFILNEGKIYTGHILMNKSVERLVYAYFVIMAFNILLCPIFVFI